MGYNRQHTAVPPHRSDPGWQPPCPTPWHTTPEMQRADKTVVGPSRPSAATSVAPHTASPGVQDARADAAPLQALAQALERSPRVVAQRRFAHTIQRSDRAKAEQTQVHARFGTAAPAHKSAQVPGPARWSSPPLGHEPSEPAAGGVPGVHTITPPAGVSGGVVQRAIGFEFEFGEWRTRHAKDKSLLAKGEPILTGPGFKVEGEDAGSESAIEVVTSPFTSYDDARGPVEQGRTFLRSVLGDGKKIVNASAYGGDAGVDIEPKAQAGKMQASPAVALDQIAGLFGKAGGTYKTFAQTITDQMDNQGFKTQHLGGEQASAELKGLVVLIVDYLNQGAAKTGLLYPKSAFRLMARTSFTKMFSLVPEHTFFGQAKNRDQWVDMVLSAAQVIGSIGKETTGKTLKKKYGLLGPWQEVAPTTRDLSKKEIRQAPVMDMPLAEMQNLPADQRKAQQSYKLKVTREEWLKTMPDADLLSKATDQRFEGMGAYGDATDLESVPQPDAPKDLVGPLTKAPEKPLGVEEGALSPAMEKVVEQAVHEVLPKVEDQVDAKSGGLKTPKTGTEPSQGRVPREAPLFELRGLKDMFDVEQNIGLDDWLSRVQQVFKIVDEANGGASFAPQGKPTVAPDVDNLKIWKKS